MAERFDIKEWIYSKPMAEWIAEHVAPDAAQMADCICMAPHRTMREKRSGLEKLYQGADGTVREQIGGRIRRMEAALSEEAEASGRELLYRLEIYYMGQKEELLPDLIFPAKGAAISAFLEYIEKNVRQKEDTAGLYYAVASILELEEKRQQYQCMEQLIVRHDGEIIGSRETIGAAFRCQRLPYPSGTILTSAASPFLPPVKGVLVNREEPWESGFAENDYGQWMLCPQLQGRMAVNGICAVNLTDYYNPFSDAPDCNLPYKQLLDAYEGSLDAQEEWLAQLSRMVQKDKSIMNRILHDRRPERGGSMAERRTAYVRSLAGYLK